LKVQKNGSEAQLSKKSGVVGKKELKEYKEACLSAKFYPFSLIFSDKQVEMVALDAL